MTVKGLHAKYENTNKCVLESAPSPSSLFLINVWQPFLVIFVAKQCRSVCAGEFSLKCDYDEVCGIDGYCTPACEVNVIIVSLPAVTTIQGQNPCSAWVNIVLKQAMDLYVYKEYAIIINCFPEQIGTHVHVCTKFDHILMSQVSIN